MKSLDQELRASIAAAGAPSGPGDRQLLEQVAGAGGGTIENYLYGGMTTAFALRAILSEQGGPAARFERILDFGCGSGRVIRWFRDLGRSRRIRGVDIHSEAIRWCRSHLPDIDFRTNRSEPPLELAAGAIDLVLGISVVTHLDEALGLAWIGELARITAPGGLVLLSIHGEKKARLSLSPSELACFERDGFFFQRPDVRDGSLAGLPDFYQVAYHSRGAVERSWSRWFEPVLFVSHGPFYQQELVVLRKPAGERVAQQEAAIVDLPLAAIELPVIASKPAGGEVVVSGWSFHLDRPGPAPLEVWIDGELAGSCEASLHRPDVSSAFGANPHGVSSGFAFSRPLAGLAEGHHGVFVTLAGSKIPLGTTYFTVGNPPPSSPPLPLQRGWGERLRSLLGRD
jgi:SAM-dependent methyltransferase